MQARPAGMPWLSSPMPAKPACHAGCSIATVRTMRLNDDSGAPLKHFAALLEGHHTGISFRGRSAGLGVCPHSGCPFTLQSNGRCAAHLLSHVGRECASTFHVSRHAQSVPAAASVVAGLPLQAQVLILRPRAPVRGFASLPRRPAAPREGGPDVRAPLWWQCCTGLRWSEFSAQHQHSARSLVCAACPEQLPTFSFYSTSHCPKMHCSVIDTITAVFEPAT